MIVKLSAQNIELKKINARLKLLQRSSTRRCVSEIKWARNKKKEKSSQKPLKTHLKVFAILKKKLLNKWTREGTIERRREERQSTIDQ